MSVVLPIVRIAKESTRGSTPGSPTWIQLEMEGAGLRIQESRSAYEGRFSSAGLRTGRVIKTGQRADGPLTIPFTAAQAQTLFEIGYKRTNGVLDSYTIDKKEVEERRFQGAVCNQLTIDWAAGDDPVRMTIDWNCLKATSTSGTSAGTYPSGQLFMGHLTTIEIDGVAYTADQLSGRIIIANNLIVGPPGAAGWPKFIKDGARRVGIELRNSYESNALASIMRDSDPVEVEVSFFTGVEGEEFTLTLPLVQFLDAPKEATEIGANEEQSLTGVAQATLSEGTYGDEIVPSYSTGE